MIKHIVLFKIKQNISDQSIIVLNKALIELQQKIPGIIDFVWGESISPEHLEKGYTHGFIMTFENEKNRNGYIVDPFHKDVISKYIDPICEDVLVFDIASG